MAHYAFLDEKNVVTEVITGRDENELLDGLTPEEWYGNYRGQRCVRTSYNGRIRIRFAGIGCTYNETLDAFVPPQCHPEANFNADAADWDCNNADHDLPEQLND